ncbi:MAG: molybdopterin-synthase adenylyltransferase MoeB [Pseudomonadota bacterium]|nr:molybdopterin-synthase adenylyltransferase MoeB [Pseudomonadota bacterium]
MDEARLWTSKTYQEQLADSTILIVGLGGLGSPVVMYLAANGVGHLILIDSDCLELTNLQRQILYHSHQIDQPKAILAQKQLQTLNPKVYTTALTQRVDRKVLETYINTVNVVVDCSDNFATRFLINNVCVQTGTPLVSGAAVHGQGQISVFLPAQAHSPCYRCLYDDVDVQTQTCSETGILAPVVGVIGSLQALEVLKICLNLGATLCGKLCIFEAFTLQWRTLKVFRDPHCPTCSQSNSRKPG